MTYTQLKAGLNACLQTVFPMVSDDPAEQTYVYYGLEIVEGYQTPCFFTRLETGESRPSNKATIYNRLTYSIMYFPTQIDEVDLMDKIDKIRSLFELGVIITAGDEKRCVDCVDFDWGFGGTERDVLEISIDLEYLTDIRPPETADIMADATLNLQFNEEV